MGRMLLNKIKKKKAIIGVIGLGYVGLPLAVEIAKNGYNVIGLDIQVGKIGLINKGISYIDGVANKDLKFLVEKSLLKATNDTRVSRSIDCVIICVPTPIDEYKIPNMNYMKNSIGEIKKYFHKDMLIVLESTTYPEITEELLLPLLDSTGLKCGKDYYLAYSAERIDLGNKEYYKKNYKSSWWSNAWMYRSSINVL